MCDALHAIMFVTDVGTAIMFVHGYSVSSISLLETIRHVECVMLQIAPVIDVARKANSGNSLL